MEEREQREKKGQKRERRKGEKEETTEGGGGERSAGQGRAGQGRGEAGRWVPARQERGARALRRSPDRVQAGVGGQLAWGRALIVLLFTRPRPKGD